MPSFTCITLYTLLQYKCETNTMWLKRYARKLSNLIENATQTCCPKWWIQRSEWIKSFQNFCLELISGRWNHEATSRKHYSHHHTFSKSQLTMVFNKNYFCPYTTRKRNSKYLLILFYCKLFHWEFRLCNSAGLPTNDNCLLSKLQFWPQQIYTLKDKYIFWTQQLYIYIR